MLIMADELKRARLISPAYVKQQEALHKNDQYGVASEHFAPIVAKVINQYQVGELLDYGAGKGRLVKAITAGKMVDHPMRFQHYEPAMPQWADIPEPAEMVACIDVLEHIEPDRLDNVLDDLQRVTLEVGLFTVATAPAMKTLDDGRNAHLIVEPAEWWLPKIMERWELHVFQRTVDGFLVLVKTKHIKGE